MVAITSLSGTRLVARWGGFSFASSHGDPSICREKRKFDHAPPPNQQDYRSSEEWEVFCGNLSGIQKSQRPHLVRSHCTQIVVDVIGGHRFVDNDFVAH